uniref:CUB domain-containing protein n=1 Tax=Rhabditophanes sp. KR3021 TaxID=114890 RepID=A0AC35U8Y0_9BILA
MEHVLMESVSARLAGQGFNVIIATEDVNEFPKGYIFDGPNNYHSSMKCTWIITNPLNQNSSPNSTKMPLHLRFDQFDTECSWDYVYIYDGDGVHGTQLGALSGSLSPIDFIAKSGSALVYFTSDVAFNMAGFNISYDYNTCISNCSYHGKCVDGRCLCESGFKGDFCQISFCDISMNDKKGPCLNGGSCKKQQCECTSNYHGEYCQEEITKISLDQLLYNGSIGARASHTSFLVNDQIWIYGGTFLSGNAIKEMAVYDIKSKTVSIPKPDGDAAFPLTRYDHSMVLFKNKLYIFGGVINKKTITNEFWSFDLVTKQFVLLNAHNESSVALPKAVAGHSALVIGDEMYVFFGYNPYDEFIHQTQIFSFRTGKWRKSRVDPFIEGRYGHTSVLINNQDRKNIVLIYGGYNAPIDESYSYVISNQLLEFDPADESWIELNRSQKSVYKHSAVLLNDIMIIFGGNAHNESSFKKDSQCLSQNILAYDTLCDEWIPLPLEVKKDEKFKFELYGHSAVVYKNGMYVSGGFNGRMLDGIMRLEPPSCHHFKDQNDCNQQRRNDVTFARTFMEVIKNTENKGKLSCTREHSFNRCALQKDCKKCMVRKECTWCDGTRECSMKSEPCDGGLKGVFDDVEQCPTNEVAILRRCDLAKGCHACKQMSHCSWLVIETTQSCISLHEEELILKKQRQRQIERLSSSSFLGSAAHTHSARGFSVSNILSSLPTFSTMSTNHTCPLPCAVRNTCSSCLTSQCMWCPMTQRCVDTDTYMISFPYGQCQGWVTSVNHQACFADSNDCSLQKTSDECQLSGPQCGWCDDGSETGLGKCIQGSLSGPLNSTQCSLKNWFYVGAPKCQCNGHSKCESISSSSKAITTQSHIPSNSLMTLSKSVSLKCGECSNQTTGDHCEKCSPGFFGDARNGGSCQRCECNGQAEKCNHKTGSCFCTTKGVTGDRCDRCEPKYYGDPKNNKLCYYDLAVDFIFTFKLDSEESKDKYVTQINFFSVPYKKDTDVQFTVVCDGSSGAEVSLNLTSTEPDGEMKTKQLMLRNKCDNKGIRRTYSASEPGFAFGTDSNTTFLVKVDNFKTPIKIQISFAQSPPINWVLFFVIFAACFIVLLVVAGLLWMIKLRFQDWRENQRRYDEIEQMSSRPFASVKLELASGTNKTTPIAVEPSANYRTGIFSCVVRLPTGSGEYTPFGTSGIAVASSVCFLTPSQLALLQTPDASESKVNCKVSIKRFLPFMSRH